MRNGTGTESLHPPRRELVSEVVVVLDKVSGDTELVWDGQSLHVNCIQ